jgi:WhiB family transcriptional regulator, redox-sensing transcriptional regulator
MVTSTKNRWLVGIAWRLDRLRWVPRDLLNKIVKRDGTCAWTYTNGDPPQLTSNSLSDPELALWLCGHCPVRDECLELELRTAGEQTAGVWGGLNEDDRRALYPHWRQRGERAEPIDTEGGPTS